MMALALAGAPCAAWAQDQAPDQTQDISTAASEHPVAYAVALVIRDQVGSKYRGFYAPRAFWPLWMENETLGRQADRFVDLLASADADGLDPRDYHADDLRQMLTDARADSSPEALARAELKLSAAFATYLRDVRAPRLKITYLDQELVPRREKPDELLRVAALAPSFPEYVAAMGWMSPIYAKLRTAIADYGTRWSDLPPVTIPPGPDLKLGAKGARVAALRQRLGMADGVLFDKTVAARVRAWQTDHGVPATGIAGVKTLAGLDRGEGDYIRLLKLNLERARVLPGAYTRHVVVDAASARLWYFEDGKAQGSMKVVVGMPTSQTPMLAGMVRYAILNPYWNVPVDLVRKLIVPKIRAGATLASMHYEALSDWGTDPRVLSPDEIDWQGVADGSTELRVRQLPGAGNSMGKMKFMFPNDLGIYLHDTPDRKLFLKTTRQFSNGCIRLEDAPRLGKWFFGKPLLPESGDPEQQVALPEPVPVYLTYLTASPTEAGVAFFNDNYGRDGGRPQGFASR